MLVACNKSKATGAAPAGAASAVSVKGHDPDKLLAVGDDAPDLQAVAQTGQAVNLKELRGKPVVVYFYPRDDTPGCTVEAQGLRDEWSALQATGAVVIGVSTDANESHKAFAEKHQLPFLLLPDPDGKIAAQFGVPVTLGFAKRVTFVIDAQGKIAKVFPSVQPKGHAQEVLAALKSLS
jgi:peroxiredoxin Q/BCP